jgi:tetratricopeptide (TPR) repeat protein
VAAARRDAAQAAREGLAAGHYASGQIAEELGQFDQAVQSYRQAVSAHPARDEVGNRYRIALARLLLQPQQDRRTSQAPASNPSLARLDERAPSLTFMALVLSLALQPDQPVVGAAAQQEAERLIAEVLSAREDAVPFDVRAQALALKGQYTQALTTYVDGLQPLLPGRYVTGLKSIIQDHPALRRPDVLNVANPVEAEKRYAEGLNLFTAGKYAEAEKDFLAAVESDNQDARYFYFLGLSRLLQNKRSAYEDFEQGSRLEQLNRPGTAAVSAALERIQGPTRRIINDARTQPR